MRKVKLFYNKIELFKSRNEKKKKLQKCLCHYEMCMMRRDLSINRHES